jgi:hypothetical protein
MDAYRRLLAIEDICNLMKERDLSPRLINRKYLGIRGINRRD